MTSLIGCSGKGEEKKQIVIFAASSLTDVMNDIKETYEKQNPEVELIINLAGTKTLTNQLENGAEADIFLSASEKYCRRVDEQGMIERSQAYLNNRMVLIVPKDGKKVITSMEDLQSDHDLILADAKVPAGTYARQVLKNYNKLHGDNYSNKVLSNLKSSETNVRQVTTKVMLGEGDAAIVYATDVTDQIKDKVNMIEIPSEYNVVGQCWIALLKGREADEAVVACYNFLTNECREICEARGFGVEGGVKDPCLK